VRLFYAPMLRVPLPIYDLFLRLEVRWSNLTLVLPP
jgi:hypothetical protein